MSDPGDILPQPRLRVMQMTAGTMLLGVLVFLGIALFLVQREGHGVGRQHPMPVLSYVAMAFLSVILAVWYFLPAQIAKQQVRKIADGTWTLGRLSSQSAPNPRLSSIAFRTDTAKLLAVSQTTNMLGWALLQAAAFVGCMAYLMEARRNHSRSVSSVWP